MTKLHEESKMAQRATILVVDDNLPMCEGICDVLAGEEYTVDMALSGEEALSKERENEYDVIITDLMMPGLSGMDLLKAMEEKGSDIKVIIITGYPSIVSAVQAIKFGAFDYIPKPFTPNELRSLVSRALKSKLYREKEMSAEVKLKEEHKISIPRDLYCIPENSWAMIEQGGNVRIGVHHAFLRIVKEIVTIDSPRENETRYQGEVCVRIIDSQKHVHRVWTPVSGKVVAVNEDVKRDHSILMKNPYKDGWLVIIEPIHIENDLKNLVLRR